MSLQRLPASPSTLPRHPLYKGLRGIDRCININGATWRSGIMWPGWEVVDPHARDIVTVMRYCDRLRHVISIGSSALARHYAAACLWGERRWIGGLEICGKRRECENVREYSFLVLALIEGYFGVMDGVVLGVGGG